MKSRKNNLNLSASLGGVFLAIGALISFQLMIPARAWTSVGMTQQQVTRQSGAQPESEAMPPPASEVSDLVTVHAAGRGNPWINLRDGRDLPTVYTGSAGLKQTLEQNLTQPRALASGDFDEDGVPDLVSGYAGPYGGLITLHRGNVDFLFPKTQNPGPKTQDYNQEAEAHSRPSVLHPPSSILHPQPFHLEADVFEIPAPPDFLGVGDFDADGHWDMVTAARGSDALYWLPGDGQGKFAAAREVELPGIVTALMTGEINRRDGLDDVIVGVVGADGPEVLVFESPEGALRAVTQTSVWENAGPQTKVRATFEGFLMPAEVNALAIGWLDGSYEVDLAVAAGTELILVSGRDRRLSLDESQQAAVLPAVIDQRSFPFVIRSLALGNFVTDPESLTDIALLADDGSVHLLTNPHRGVPERETTGGAALRGRSRRAMEKARAHGEILVQPPARKLEQWPSEILTTSDQRPATSDQLSITTTSAPVGCWSGRIRMGRGSPIWIITVN